MWTLTACWGSRGGPGYWAGRHLPPLESRGDPDPPLAARSSAWSPAAFPSPLPPWRRPQASAQPAAPGMKEPERRMQEVGWCWPAPPLERAGGCLPAAFRAREHPGRWVEVESGLGRWEAGWKRRAAGDLWWGQGTGAPGSHQASRGRVRCRQPAPPGRTGPPWLGLWRWAAGCWAWRWWLGWSWLACRHRGQYPAATPVSSKAAGRERQVKEEILRNIVSLTTAAAAKLY